MGGGAVTALISRATAPVKLFFGPRQTRRAFRCSALQPPDVPDLPRPPESLSPKEVEEFAPKIRQVIDWFGQLQAVDLENIEPSLEQIMKLVSTHDKISQ